MAALCAVLWAAACSGSVEWNNADEENRVGGRMISAGYLKGKVVLVDCRDYGSPASADALLRLQALWGAYKSKPFVLVGSHRGSSSAKKAAAAMKKSGVTFPVYRGFTCTKEPKPREGDEDMALIYVMDETGRRLYAGPDDRAASGIVGSALINMAAPQSQKEWRRYLDWEVENTPGRAYLRLKEFAQKHPSAAKEAYGEKMIEMSKSSEIKKLAKLVAAMRLIKDRDPSSPAAQKITKSKVDDIIEQYEDLKDAKNPAVVQEAKNALAELKWISATLKK